MVAPLVDCDVDKNKHINELNATIISGAFKNIYYARVLGYVPREKYQVAGAPGFRRRNDKKNLRW
jgi:hypothetical protein